MTEKEQENKSPNRISQEERLNYIGFDVFPGKAGDIFKSSQEKEKLVASLKNKREHHDQIREGCTLMVERVSSVDRIVLTIACAVIIISLFLPWYTLHNEFVEESKFSPEPAPQTVIKDNAETDPAAEIVSDSMLAAGDVFASTDTATTADTLGVATPTPEKKEAGASDGKLYDADGDEIITSLVARKKITREYASVSAVGSLVSLGTTGSYLFSSGIILILTTVIMLIYTLLCLALPAYTLYGIYGLKGSEDEKALGLKKIIKLNWIPVVLFLVVFSLSFLGTEYGFDSVELFTSLGKSYGPGVFLGSLSSGLFVALFGFILIAAKSGEI